MTTVETKPYHLLLVEDNTDDVELARAAWETSSLEVRLHVAQNGLEAVSFLRGENGYERCARPDLILLDLNMPVMDGRQALEVIKNDADLCDIPVLVLTTSQDREDIMNAYRSHANCFLNKPEDFDQFSELARAIENFWLRLAVLPAER